MAVLIPISTVFIGCHGLLALGLSYRVAMERVRSRIWHGATAADVADQSQDQRPGSWAALVETMTQKLVTPTADKGLLQRTMRAHGNFTEYVPLGLLFLVALELMGAAAALIWGLGALLILARIAHAWGLIQTYGPSPGRAIGFFGTWLVYILGSLACLYYGLGLA